MLPGDELGQMCVKADVPLPPAVLREEPELSCCCVIEEERPDDDGDEADSCVLSG